MFSAMFYLKLLCKVCYVTQTKVGMPWLLEGQEVNIVLKTSDQVNMDLKIFSIKDLPLWQKDRLQFIGLCCCCMAVPFQSCF